MRAGRMNALDEAAMVAEVVAAELLSLSCWMRANFSLAELGPGSEGLA